MGQSIRRQAALRTGIIAAVAALSLGSVASAGVSKVLCVPWKGDPNLPHTAISGQSVNLCAVVYGDATGGTVSYSWDFTDGSPNATGNIAVPANSIYNLQVAHTFTGGINTPFITSVTVGGQADTYKIILATNNNDSKENIAIDKGLWYLHTQVIRDTGGSPAVPRAYWNDSGTGGVFYVGRTSACVWAFEVQGHLLTVEAAPLSPVEDPYVENVQRGINYLLSSINLQNPLSAQTYGNPDVNANGYGLVCYNQSSHTNYENGLALGAISGCGKPSALTTTGITPQVLGRSYHDIVQDMVEWYAWSQAETANFPPTGPRGGWNYTASNNAAWGPLEGDNSASQWAYIGIEAAEENFGCTFPAWAREQLAGYLHGQISYGNRGFVSYRAGPTGHSYFTPNDVCLTGGAMVGMALVSETTFNAVNGAGTYATDLNLIRTFLGTKWQGTTSQWEENWYGHRAYYTMYAVMKGLRMHGLSSLPGSPGTADWYADYVGVMLPDQKADGHWRGTGWMDSYIVDDMGTAFGVLILTPSVFAPPPVACFAAEPNPGYLDIPVSFDPSCSYHSDGTKHLVLYEWDWDNNGAYDQSSTTPDIVTHTWDSTTYPLASYPVTLRVTDDSVPPVTDTVTVNINLTTPPHPPVGRAGGPYMVSLCAGDSLRLDGSDSFDIDEGQSQSGNPPFDTIISWNWDLDGSPWNYTNASSEVVTLNAAQIATYFTAGAHDIGVKVTDNTALAYPASGQPNLTDEDFTTVTAYAGCACDLSTQLVCGDSVLLTWSQSGSYEVLRSTAGPNTGFAKIADVDGTGYNDVNVAVGVTYYYRLRGANCLSSFASATRPAGTAPRAVAWKSVKTHTGIGEIAIDLDPSKTDADTGVNGPVSEPRRYGITKIVVDFDVAVNAADGSLDPGDVLITDSLSVAYPATSVALTSGNRRLEINFNPALPDEKRYTVELACKFESAAVQGLVLGGDTNCQIRGLLGDGEDNGIVNIGDLNGAKNALAQAVSAANARFDSNTDGLLNVIDMAMIKSRLTRAAP